MSRLRLMRVVSLALIALPLAVFAQPEEVQYNPNSLNPIPRYEHLFKLRVWRIIDLREKQNKGFFANNGQITKLITDAAISGEIAEVSDCDLFRSDFALIFLWAQDG